MAPNVFGDPAAGPAPRDDDPLMGANFAPATPAPPPLPPSAALGMAAPADEDEEAAMDELERQMSEQAIDPDFETWPQVLPIKLLGGKTRGGKPQQKRRGVPSRLLEDDELLQAHHLMVGQYTRDSDKQHDVFTRKKNVGTYYFPATKEAFDQLTRLAVIAGTPGHPKRKAASAFIKRSEMQGVDDFTSEASAIARMRSYLPGDWTDAQRDAALDSLRSKTKAQKMAELSAARKAVTQAAQVDRIARARAHAARPRADRARTFHDLVRSAWDTKEGFDEDGWLNDLTKANKRVARGTDGEISRQIATWLREARSKPDKPLTVAQKRTLLRTVDVEGIDDGTFGR